MNMLEIKNLTKRFGNLTALDGLSFSVREGELFAFLGENGAGKSTTINIICRRILKDSGTVLINGVDLDSHSRELLRYLGVVFQSSVLDAPLSVYDNLQSRGALYGITGQALRQRVAELSELLHLEDLLRRPFGKLSGGQQRRVDIARALLHRPRLLILDEPTTGLDVQSRALIWKVIGHLRHNDGMTVFLTTHYMEEAGDADNVVIIESGKIAAGGTPLELKNRYTGDFINLYGVTREAAQSLGRNFLQIRDGYKIFVSNTAEATQLILEHPEVFRDYEITKGKMDDVFLAVTGRNISSEEANK